ncbi:transposase domain-containing protein [Streptomyces fructofermentans]|uniref:transposase domain-containing protein n=1 Tax=Streptomyces fructofermentans TaxID=152141 RepID=UPI0037A90CE2
MASSASDLLGLGLLTWLYPPGLVDRVVAACGRAEQRRRLLPARLVVYFALGLALFSPAPYLEVIRHLVAGLRGLGLLGDWHVPAKSSLIRARQRLGFEPLQVLFAATAKTMADESTPGAFWRGLRVLAVDGTCWDVADTEANQAAFGRPGSGCGAKRSAFVQVRMAALVEVGSWRGYANAGRERRVCLAAGCGGHAARPTAWAVGCADVSEPAYGRCEAAPCRSRGAPFLLPQTT